MAPLRAMLQLRPGYSSLSSSPSHHPVLTAQTYSPPHPHSQPHPLSHPDSAAYIHSSTRSSGPHSGKKTFHNLGLHSGAAFGNLGLVKFALDNGQPIDSAINGVQPIHAACCNNGNVPVVLFLIERGADVNARRCPRKYSGERSAGSQAVGTTGSTPLHFAAANGCITIVETLLRHGATADLADKYGSTPYSVATARGHAEVASLLHQHACMQRGLQVITPDADYRDSREKDPFTSPRSSSDFSRRVSAIMAPTRSCTQQSETLPSPQSTTTASAAAAAAAAAASVSSRVVGQRRVSLPSIMEAPSSPVMTAAPRQSCDLSRVPLLNEPLDPRLDSADFRGISTQQRPSLDQTRPSQSQDKKTDKHQQRLRLAQSALLSPVKTLELSPNTARRRSVDAQASGYLSPPPTRPVLRRASFDQLAAMRPGENKPRRDSDASNSETIVSSPSSCSTLASPMTLSGNNSRTKLDMSPLQETCLMARSISQPPSSPLRNGSVRRITSASEPGPRQSFDIRMFASSREEGEDYDNYRRRSMQEPRTMDYDERASFLRSIKMTPSASASLFQDGKPRSSKHQRGSFSGSATISGRFSRLWAHYSSGKDSQDESLHDKESSTSSMGSVGDMSNDGMWNASDMSKTQDAGAKSRSGVMNRLSGMWTRR